MNKEQAFEWLHGDRVEYSGCRSAATAYEEAYNQLQAENARLREENKELAGGFKRDLAHKLQQQTAKNKRLRKENEAWKQRTEDRDRTIEIQRLLFLELREELAAAQVDAKRYRWLRSRKRGMSGLSTVINDDCQPPYYELKCEAELDEAIDYAIANEQS